VIKTRLQAFCFSVAFTFFSFPSWYLLEGPDGQRKRSNGSHLTKMSKLYIEYNLVKN